MATRFGKTGKIDPRPPQIIEAVVERLTPHAFRECVVGDLAERYTSPGRYLMDAARTVAALVIGQAHRAFDPVLVAAEAAVLTIAFVSTSGAGPRGFAALLVGLAVLRLREAYAYGRPMSRRTACLDAIVATTMVLIFEVVAMLTLSPWAVETDILARGVGLSLLGVSLVRIVFQDNGSTRQPTPHPQRNPYAVCGLWILAGTALLASNSESVPALAPLRHPVLALSLLFALGRTPNSPWIAGAMGLYFAAWSLPLLSVVSAGELPINAPQLAIHVIALLTLSMLWRIRRSAWLPA